MQRTRAVRLRTAHAGQARRRLLWQQAVGNHSSGVPDAVERPESCQGDRHEPDGSDRLPALTVALLQKLLEWDDAAYAQLFERERERRAEESTASTFMHRPGESAHCAEARRGRGVQSIDAGSAAGRAGSQGWVRLAHIEPAT